MELIMSWSTDKSQYRVGGWWESLPVCQFDMPEVGSKDASANLSTVRLVLLKPVRKSCGFVKGISTTVQPAGPISMNVVDSSVGVESLANESNTEFFAII